MSALQAASQWQVQFKHVSDNKDDKGVETEASLLVCVACIHCLASVGLPPSTSTPQGHLDLRWEPGGGEKGELGAKRPKSEAGSAKH